MKLSTLVLLLIGLRVVLEAQTPPAATTPIQHVVVIFQENVSFDHYFATYPVAANKPGEQAFHALPNTPSVNGLSGALLTNNPNSAQPVRLDRSQAVTCDQDHAYLAEQKAYNSGLLNKFVETVGATAAACDVGGLGKNVVMGYFDGNTVTAMWNYAQHFAMSDNTFGTTFGPSTPGAINLISAQTHGATLVNGTPAGLIAGGSLIGDPNPTGDDCSPRSTATATMTGKNVGDLLNAKGLTWGWFQGGFKPTTVVEGKAVCGARHNNISGASAGTDYSAHHEPFQYYQQTTNPHHLPPTSVAKIGQADQANHQYDVTDFQDALKAGVIPAVSYLKAPSYQDGHAGYSDPVDEQMFVVGIVNQVMQSRFWDSTVVMIAYDDSDGWYDHVMPPMVTQSTTPSDSLTGVGACGDGTNAAYQGRCGYGPRLPLIVISPYAKVNYVNHTVTDQGSILRFIEDNWKLGRIGDHSMDEVAGSLLGMFNFEGKGQAKALLLDPNTGQVKK